MLLNCGVGEDSWESLGLQGDATSPSLRKSFLNIHWKDWWWSWNSNTLATWCKELTRLKRPWCWARLKAGGEGDNRGWVGWMASPTWWTWSRASFRSWWWTGKPGVLQSMGSQRVGHNWVTELTDWSLLGHVLKKHLMLWLLFKMGVLSYFLEHKSQEVRAPLWLIQCCISSSWTGVRSVFLMLMKGGLRLWVLESRLRLYPHSCHLLDLVSSCVYWQVWHPSKPQLFHLESEGNSTNSMGLLWRLSEIMLVLWAQCWTLDLATFQSLEWGRDGPGLISHLPSLPLPHLDLLPNFCPRMWGNLKTQQFGATAKSLPFTFQASLVKLKESNPHSPTSILRQNS